MLQTGGLQAARIHVYKYTGRIFKEGARAGKHQNFTATSIHKSGSIVRAADRAR
jgi:hypothetical protein